MLLGLFSVALYLGKKKSSSPDWQWFVCVPRFLGVTIGCESLRSRSFRLTACKVCPFFRLKTV